MERFHDFAAELPDPRDDEPADLRRDIADELADHLNCAVARERLLAGGGRDEDVLSAALENFGDPAAVARRLWWDAMKEKIMAQRFISGLALVASAASLLCAVLMWQVIQNNREAQAALLASQRDMMQAMIDELKNSADRSTLPAAESESWQLLRVNLVDEAGNPVIGTVRLSGNTGGQAGGIQQRIATDQGGIADFGKLPLGPYSLQVESSGECVGPLSIVHGPGRSSDHSIVCPGVAVDMVPLQFSITPPEELKTCQLYYVVQISRVGREVGGEAWRPRRPVRHSVLLDSQGTVLGKLPEGYMNIPVIGENHWEGPFMTGIGLDAKLANLIPADVTLAELPGLLRGRYEVAFAPFVPSTGDTHAASDRPALMRVGRYIVCLMWKLGEHDDDACRLGPSAGEFWKMIAHWKKPHDATTE